MKKHIGLLIVLITLLFTAACAQKEGETKPFETLSKDHIQEVSLLVTPPEAEIILSNELTEQLVPILNQLVVYKKVSPEELVGQLVRVTITKTDGSTIVIDDLNPYLVINDVWYEMKYEPGEELNAFANEIIDSVDVDAIKKKMED